MQYESRLAPRSWVLGWIVGLGFFAGCLPSTPLDQAGVSLKLPQSWRPAPRTKWNVPGTPLAAWSGPGGSSLVVFRTLPVPGGSASSYAEGLANRLDHLPGLEIVSRKPDAIGGLDAARVEAVAAGFGDALAPSGTGTPIGPEGVPLIPTRAVQIAFLRPADTIGVICHAPESEWAGLSAQLDEILKSLKIDRGRLATSSY